MPEVSVQQATVLEILSDLILELLVLQYELGRAVAAHARKLWPVIVFWSSNCFGSLGGKGDKRVDRHGGTDFQGVKIPRVVEAIDSSQQL